MKNKYKNNQKAIIILHEIYGVNEFINSQCQKYKESGYDIICPNIIHRPPFLYEEATQAYEFFTKKIGFDVYKKVSDLVVQLKESYSQVFILGFSIGATIAFLCCENPLCSGIIACYGSRIRDYTTLNPACPTLLLFAKKDTFDVGKLVHKLQNKQNLSMLEFDGEHGFLDSFSSHYNPQQTKLAEGAIAEFLWKHTH